MSSEITERELTTEEAALFDQYEAWVKSPGDAPCPYLPHDLQGVNLSGRKLDGAHWPLADLRGANLTGVTLRKANLKGAKLDHANLEWASFDEADLSGAYLRHANARRATFDSATLRCAQLEHADLRGANVSWANLRMANLVRAEVGGVRWNSACLEDANLSGARGVPSAADFLARNFEWTDQGFKAYKSMGRFFNPPASWDLRPGATIRESGSHNATTVCGSGVNMATLQFMQDDFLRRHVPIWELLVPFRSLPGVVVPFGSASAIRVVNADVILVAERSREELLACKWKPTETQ